MIPRILLSKASWKLAATLVLASTLAAAEPPDGDRMIEAYFRGQVKQIENDSLAGIKTLEDWQKVRPELRRQFLEMVGLWPLPDRTPLQATVTGKIDAENFTVEKIHFQSFPGLYVTANLYVPKNIKEPLPAVLYVCGHGNTVIDKVSYGSKVNYQHHPTWFAEHGYVSMVLDTLQLAEIEGIHHGLHRYGMWWWQTLGYTPAGIECWNAMRALDYLQSRKEVDPKRLGVTGRSGGGATSWWVAAADERVQCIIPVAGLADLWGHVVEGDTPRLQKGVIAGHCDCMYFVNTYRWDFDKVIALCAPRALMLGNSNADAIFPVDAYRRPAAKARRIYDLYGASDKFVLLETEGPHRDTPELRLGAYRWMNRWLKGEEGPAVEQMRPRFTAQQLKVFDRLPEDANNRIIHELFIKPGKTAMPNNPEVVREWWKGQKKEWLAQLEEKVFRGWTDNPPSLDVKPAGEVTHKGLRLRAFDFVSEENIPLRLWLMTAVKTEKVSLVVLNVLDEPGYQEWCAGLGPNFKDILQADRITLSEKEFESNLKTLEAQGWAFAAVAPRGVGPTRWSDNSPHIRRRFALIGQTLDGQRVWDVRRGLACLRAVDDLRGLRPWLQGKGDSAGLALYASLFESDIERLDLWNPPASHMTGPILLNVRKVLDMPQAMALAFPTRIRLYVENDEQAKAWEWPLRLQTALGEEALKIRVAK